MFLFMNGRRTQNDRTYNTKDINYAIKIEETMISVNFLGHHTQKSPNKSQMSENIKETT